MRSIFRSTSLLPFALVGLLTPQASAGQIRVPADYPTLAAALAAAAPNDVILVQTQVQQSNVVITKPVTIVGDPLLKIRNADGACGVTAIVKLEGAGAGTVTIANAEVSSSMCGSPAAGVSGTGFDSLFLFEVEIWGMTGILTGSANGVEGVRTTGIPLITLERCFVRSTQNGTDDCFSPPSTLGGKHNRAAVDVGHATLLALDSTLRGGNGGLLCTKSAQCAPSDWIPLIGGEGASAVKAGKFYSANSIVEAGVGSTYINYVGGGPGQTCWAYGSHPAVIAASDIPLAGTIQAVGNPLPASTWFLDFVLPSGASYALGSFGPGAPISVPGLGTAFLDPATFFSLGLLSASGGAGNVQYLVPNDLSLLGVPLCMQPLHASQGLLRPVTAVIAP